MYIFQRTWVRFQNNYSENQNCGIRRRHDNNSSVYLNYVKKQMFLHVAY